VNDHSRSLFPVVVLVLACALPATGNAQGNVYCQQSPGQPMYGPYHGTGNQRPCGPNFQPAPQATPNPLPWEQPAYAANQIRPPQSGVYLTYKYVPGGTPTRASRSVRLTVNPGSATLQTPQRTFNLKYLGTKQGGSNYSVTGTNQTMLFVERAAGVLQYDVYYQSPGQLLEETWIPQ